MPHRCKSAALKQRMPTICGTALETALTAVSQSAAVALVVGMKMGRMPALARGAPLARCSHPHSATNAFHISWHLPHPPQHGVSALLNCGSFACSRIPACFFVQGVAFGKQAQVFPVPVQSCNSAGPQGAGQQPTLRKTLTPALHAEQRPAHPPGADEASPRQACPAVTSCLQHFPTSPHPLPLPFCPPCYAMALHGRQMSLTLSCPPPCRT